MIDLNINTDNNIIIKDELELILQQIDILFDTSKTEVLGESDFGTNYDDFLYELNISNTEIENTIKNDIISYVELFDWNIDVSIKLLKGTENDIMLVSINLYKDDKSYQKNYKVK